MWRGTEHARGNGRWRKVELSQEQPHFHTKMANVVAEQGLMRMQSCVPTSYYLLYVYHPTQSFQQSIDTSIIVTHHLWLQKLKLRVFGTQAESKACTLSYSGKVTWLCLYSRNSKNKCELVVPAQVSVWDCWFILTS